MRLILTTTAAALAISVAACDTREAETANNDALAMNEELGMNETTNEGMSANGMAGNEASAMPATAGEFVATVAGSDMYEIESGKLAAAKATSAELKAFGQMLQTDHQKSTTLLKNAAANASPAVSVPSSMPAEHQAKLDALKAATGADFDRMFIDQQIQAHQRALNILNGYTQVGDRPALKTFAMNAQGVVQGHLDQLIGMKR